MLDPSPEFIGPWGTSGDPGQPRSAKSANHGVTLILKSTEPRVLREKCFNDYYVLEFVLMRFSKSGQMIAVRSQPLFYVLEFHIKFLGAIGKPPPEPCHSILLAKNT
ncbi:hypothetical protein Tco_1041188 [Tanacetum coccineum]|uniref:Uncharacterized protein n=1 Tax=Tanacetum coccineum TaxID=301880 RepID=A0ABQ5GGI3_9ASTR